VTFWLIPAMRKKERSGPGIATSADSGELTSVYSAERGPGGVVPRAPEAKQELIQRVAAKIVGSLAHRFDIKSVKRSVQAFKIASPKRNRA
jgi:hypothetical protein